MNYAVGIDIGASNTKIGLVTRDRPGHIAAQRTLPTQLDGSQAEPFVDDIVGVVRQLAEGAPIVRAGVSLCSLINADHTGAFLSVNAPALNHFNIKAACEARLGCPVQVMNDVNAYALAEYYHGAGQGVERLLVIAPGTGLAIACINAGRLLETWAGVCADAARIILDPASDVACNAGVRGTAEALCGTAHIVRLAQQRYGRDNPRWRGDVAARDVITASRNGADPIAVAVMAEIGEYIGHLAAILSPIFFPQRIVITGGTSEAGDVLFTAIRNRYATLIGDYMANLALLETGIRRPVEIVKGALGPEAAILGSVLGE